MVAGVVRELGTLALIACWSFMLSVIITFMAFVVVKALNGANGEATGLDDLADGNPLARARDRDRARREARNHLHQRPVNGGRDVDNARRRIGERVAQRPNPVEAAPVVHVTTRYVVIFPGDDYGHTGNVFVSRVAGLWATADGVVYPERPGGVAYQNVVASGPGWFEQSTNPAKGMTIVARYCIDVMFVERFKQIGCNSHYKYFIPLMKDLRCTFPGALESRVAIAARAKGSRNFDPCMPAELLSTTIDAFLAGKASDTLGHHSDESSRLVNLRYSSVGVVHDEQIAAYAVAGLQDVSGGPWTTAGVTCPHVPFRMKSIFNIRTTGQVAYDPITIPTHRSPGDLSGLTVAAREAFDAGLLDHWPHNGMIRVPTQLSGVSTPPSFTNNLGDDRPAKYRLTNYFRVIGERQFLIYDVNAANANLALKRIIGARDHEEFYYGNQFPLLSAIITHHPENSFSEVLSALRVKETDPYFIIGDVAREDAHGLRLGHLGWKARRGWVGSLADHLFPAIRHPFSSERHDDAVGFLGHQVSTLLNNCTYDSLYEKIVMRGLDACATAAHHWKYYTGYQKLLSFLSPVLSREFNASIPHAKKALRECYVKNVLLHDNEDIMVRRLNACVKKELAKGGGKVPRLFVSYGAGCMFANELPEWTKVLLDSSPDPAQIDSLASAALGNIPGVFTLSRNGLTCNIYIMSKMHSGAMDVAFRDIIAAMDVPNHLHVLIYSDDSVYVGNIDGKNFAFNVDISSCDSSQGPLVFAIVGKILTQLHPERGIGLIKQCMLPIILENPDDPASRIEINCHGPFEGSGTVLTTILNHVASYCIACAAFFVMSDNVDLLYKIWDGYDNCLAECISAGAALVGHKVTAETCRHGGEVVIEKIQFLKRSPIQTECGQWVSTLNFGCILRSFGSVEGDLSPTQLGLTPEQFVRMHDREKMEVFFSTVIKGLVHEPHSIIMDTLRALFSSTTRTLADEFGARIAGAGNSEIADANNRELVLAEASLCRRYDATPDEFRGLALCLGQLSLGRIACTPLVTKIYHVDYGL